MLRHKHQRP